jgi:PAT family beta-lactamase induction signal transducer AmpG
MGLFSPLDAPFIIGLMALGIAFISASQDIVIDAYRTDLLMPEERGMGAGIFITGYRLALLLAGAVALMLSEFMGWENTYLCMAGLMIVGKGGTLLAREPDTMKMAPISLKEAISGPLRDLFLRRKAIIVLIFIVLYKLGDAYAGTLTTAFLIRGAGFSPVEVGAINKGIGLIATIFGAIFGGTLMLRMSLYRSLLWFGLLQMVSNLSFMGLAYAGKDYRIMVIAVLFENISGGMGSAAFMAFIMTLCNKRYSATQFALLSALSALGRVFISPTSGFVVNRLGWPDFFFISTIAAIPGLACLRLLKHEILKLKMG